MVRALKQFVTSKIQEWKAGRELLRNASELEAFYEGRGFKVPVRSIIRKMLRDSKVTFAPSEERTYSFNTRNRTLRVPEGPGVDKEYFRAHEISHATSLLKTNAAFHEDEVASGNEGKKKGSREVNRSGFGTSYVEDEEELGFFFALNEAMAAETGKRATFYKQDILSQLLFMRMVGSRDHEESLFAHIVDSLARFERRSNEQVFDDFLDAYQKGWTPQLKQRLLGAFGPHVLKVLAIVDTYHRPLSIRRSLQNSRLRRRAMVFFDLSRSAEEREEAADKLLSVFDPKHDAERLRKRRVSATGGISEEGAEDDAK